MLTFHTLILFVLWPLALPALVLYPFVWLILLPFRLVMIWTLFTLPLRLLRAPGRI
jgi:hypothetical protein